MKLTNNLKKLLFLAIVLRLFVSAFLFHPDIKTIAFQTSFLKKGITNIYPYLVNNKQSLPLREEFVYFPLTYFTIGGYQAVISPLLGKDFNNWLYDAGANSVVSNPNIFKYLIFLKLPLLFMDIFIAFLLFKFFKKKINGEKAFTLWLFNPFTIILIYVFSNIDLYPILLTVIAFLNIKRKNILLGSLFLGLASCFKLYPLLFLPFMFLKGRTLKEKILSVAIPISMTVVSVIPFWSKAFVDSALVSGLTTRIFSPGFSVGFGESIIVGVFLLSALFFYALMINKKIKLFNYWIIFLLLIFSFSHFHISWLLWIAPFLVIKAIQKPKLLWPIFFWAIIAISIPLFYSDRAMTISLFRIYTTWFDLLPTPFVVLQKVYDPYNFQSLLHSSLAGLSVLISYKLI
jgi:hypothetical protein